VRAAGGQKKEGACRDTLPPGNTTRFSERGQLSTGRRSTTDSAARFTLIRWDMTAPEEKCLSGLFGTKKQEAFRHFGMLPSYRQFRNKFFYSPLFAFMQAPKSERTPNRANRDKADAQSDQIALCMRSPRVGRLPIVDPGAESPSGIFSG